jgi:asparagine synthase (glutamine-hydrolysing)
MCGIAFLWSRALTGDESGARIRSAVDRLQHRGPDATGVLTGAHFVAGHTRLAIVDLVGGQQPMQDPSRRWTLVFNGEIYNYRELRRELAGRWDFRDASDTEVLLAGLITCGPQFITRLDGMWAFALHDASGDELLLSRDRFGKKPLYYRPHAGSFACASELPALHALLPDAAIVEDARGVADYFRYGYCQPGYSCIADVREVLPGHYLQRSADGQMRETRYWSPRTDLWQGEFDVAAERVRELLKAAVLRRQLAADVEVGAFLSGGVDSTVVCALAQASGRGQLRTFTAGFAEPTYDERAHAARAAAELGTLHVAAEMTPAEAASVAARLPAHLGQPFGDSSLVPSALVAQLAGRSVKVVLTGDGSDEVFGGYARHAGVLLRQRFLRLPRLLRGAIERAVLATPEPIAHHSGSLRKKAHLFVSLVREPPVSYVAPKAIRDGVLQQLLPDLAAGHGVVQGPWPEDADELRHMMLMDWLVWLPQDILAKVDRATMMYGVEARSPFLDRELVEFVMRLPLQWHFRGFRGKRLLRAAMRGRVPEFIWQRRKQGFASPVAHWMRGGIGNEIEQLCHDQQTGPLDRVALLRVLAEHRSGRVDHSQPLWLAHAYLRWRGVLN